MVLTPIAADQSPLITAAKNMAIRLMMSALATAITATRMAPATTISGISTGEENSANKMSQMVLTSFFERCFFEEAVLGAVEALIE